MGFIAKIINKFKKKKKVKYFKKENTFAERIRRILSSYKQVNEELLNEIEEMLIVSDASVDVAIQIVDELRKRIKSKKIVSSMNTIDELMKVIHDFYERGNSQFKLNLEKNKTNVILVVGTNGSGKTTSIAKLAYYFRERKHKIRVVAADTFRAGAVQQLRIWCDRLKINCTTPNHKNQDPASVIYQGVNEAINEQCTIVICDTAGRSQTKKNLMNELTRIIKVIKKLTGNNPSETLLTIDSTSGQNGISQAKHFSEAAHISGIILTKLDGLSKGAIILPIMDQFQIPVRFIGFGETYYDISEFSIDSYLYNLIRSLIVGEKIIKGFGHG